MPIPFERKPITTSITWQLTDDPSVYIFESETTEHYSGLWADLKGDDTAKQAEIQHAAFNQQMMGIFSQQFAKQSAILEFIKGKMEPMLDNPTGFSPAAEAAMRTSATDAISQQYDNATKAIQTRQFAQGSRDLPSGVNDQLMASLAQSQAADTAAAQNNITMQNEFLKQQNYWDALNALNGVSAQVNPLGYASSVNAGSNSVANLSQAYTASQNSGLLGGVLGGVFGAGSAVLGNPGLFKH